MHDPNTKPEFKRFEEIINWTLPGLTMYYRDADLPQDIIDAYERGMIIRSQTFVDVSGFAGRPTTNCRYIFASSKAAPMFRINPATEKWAFHTINCNSYFKVLDVHQREGVTQLLLLHIPYAGIDFFRRSALILNEENLEQSFVERARTSLEQKLTMDAPPALNEPEWRERTSFPIGLDANNNFFPLEPDQPLFPMAAPMYRAIRKMTEDIEDLNEAPTPETPPRPNPPAPPVDSGRRDKKSGFWSKLFGKN